MHAISTAFLSKEKIMPEQPLSIIVDPYRHKCKTIRKNVANIRDEIQLFTSDTYDLSWVGESCFWRRLHIDVNRLENGATIQTNSSFIYDCLTAQISRSKELFSKKFIAVPPPEAKDDFEQRLQTLLKYLPSDISIPIKKIPVYISEGSRAVWSDFVNETDVTCKNLRLEFEETDNLEQADFTLIEQDEFPEIQEKKYSICFVVDTNTASEDNDIYPDENGTNGFIWSLGCRNLQLLIRKFVDFFYWKSRFIEIAEFCIKEAKLETLEKAQELISLWCSCDKEFSADEDADENLFLLVDNSIVKDVKVTQKASFNLRRFYANSWIDNDELNLTIDIPMSYNIGELYDRDSDVRRLYKNSFNANVKDAFVFTPEKRLVSTIFSESKDTTVKLRFRVVADGGTDKFGIRSSGKTDADGVYLHLLGNVLKFNVWVDNRREYDEKANPLLCTLNGREYIPVGAPERNKSEVVYTYEVEFSEVKNYVFEAKLNGMIAKCTFKVLPPADALYTGVKPVMKKTREEIQLNYYSEPVVGNIKQIEKICCFAGAEFELKTAVFNKKNLLALLPCTKDQVTPQKIFEKYGKSCYDTAYKWEICSKRAEGVCDVSAAHVKALKRGSCQLKFECSSNPQVFRIIEFVVISDRSAVIKKLLVAGLLVSFISAFWYGANFWALLFKAFCPAVVYYAGTHPEECLKNKGNKFLFWIALIVSFFILLRGLWQEIV